MTVPPTSPSPPDLARGPERVPTAWPARSVDRLLEHVLALIRVDAAAFLLVNPHRQLIRRAAGWFASPLLREALAPAERWPYDPARPGLMELVLERDRPLLLPRLEDWEAAPQLERNTVERLGEVRGSEAWEALGEASLIAAPVTSAVGRTVGALLLASQDRARPLAPSDLKVAKVLSDLCGVALERAELLDSETRSARTETRLKRA